jgi:hypothetical protein
MGWLEQQAAGASSSEASSRPSHSTTGYMDFVELSVPVLRTHGPARHGVRTGGLDGKGERLGRWAR